MDTGMKQRLTAALEKLGPERVLLGAQAFEAPTVGSWDGCFLTCATRETWSPVAWVLNLLVGRWFPGTPVVYKALGVVGLTRSEIRLIVSLYDTSRAWRREFRELVSEWLETNRVPAPRRTLALTR